MRRAYSSAALTLSESVRDVALGVHQIGAERAENVAPQVWFESVVVPQPRPNGKAGLETGLSGFELGLIGPVGGGFRWLPHAPGTMSGRRCRRIAATVLIRPHGVSGSSEPPGDGNGLPVTLGYAEVFVGASELAVLWR